MSSSWNIPKMLAKSRKLSAKEKLVVAVVLQYLNAGCSEKATPQAIKNAVGFGERQYNGAIQKLKEKNYIVEYEGRVELNHLYLIKDYILNTENYKDFHAAFAQTLKQPHNIAE